MRTPAVVIPAFRRADASRRALESLFAAGASRIFYIDDTGQAGGADIAREFPSVVVIRTRSDVWWTGAVNLGIEAARDGAESDVLLFNQDVTCAPDYFERLGEVVDATPGALVGSAVMYAGEPGRVWSAGGAVEWWGRGIRALYHGDFAASLPDGPFGADWLFGMGTYVPARVLDRIGLPDAARFPMAWADVDFSLRAKRAGFRVVVAPRARLFHEVGDYDARVAGAPSWKTYARWLTDDRHNLSLSAHAEIWRRHGPRYAWPLSLALRTAVLLVNFLRMRVLFPPALSSRVSESR